MIKYLSPILLLIISVPVFLTGCQKKTEDSKDLFGPKTGIERLEVLSATGNIKNPNYVKIQNYWDMEYLKNDSDNSLFNSETAWTLVDEVTALPDGNPWAADQTNRP